MTKLKRVDSKFLKNLYENSNNIRKTKKYTAIKYYCLHPIILEHEKGVYVSKEWFINTIDELIFYSKDNYYCVLELYEKGEDDIKNIYILETDRENNL